MQPPQQELSPEQVRRIRRVHWSDQQWSALISSVVDEIFGTAEVDEGTMNPVHLNSANRTRWLCERTMRSDKRMDEIDTKVDEIAGQQLAIEAKVDEIKAEIMEQQKVTMDKLDALLTLVSH